MKTQTGIQSQRAASTLLTVLIITGVLGVVLASYLKLLSNTNGSSMRSQAWNQTMPVIEAGLEDALTHLNLHGATNLFCDGWQTANGNLYWIQRSIPGGTYVVTISNFVAGSQNAPIVESRGYVPLPATLVSRRPGFLAAVGVGQPGLPAIARGVRLSLAKNSTYPGLFVRYGFEMQNTTGVMCDSYDSSDAAYSSNGVYVAARARQNAYIGTISRSAGILNIHQTVKVIGKVGVGASGVLALASPASVGDFAWVSSAANAGKLQPGHQDVGVKIPFPPNAVPFTSGYFTPGPGTVDGTNYAYVLAGGNYRLSQMTLSGTRLIVTKDSALLVDKLSVANGEIIVKSDATLRLYVTDSFICSGAARVNAAGRPQQFRYFGLPQNQSFQVSGSSFLSGVFNSPSSTAQFQQNAVLCGAGLFYDNQMQHNVQFHYDESLGRKGDGRLFIVTSWKEMAPGEVAALPTGVSMQ